MASVQEQCTDCKKWFVNLDNHKNCDGRRKSIVADCWMSASIKMVTERGSGKEQCPDCGKVFVNVDNHKKCDGRGKQASMKMTKERDGEKEQCPDCGKLFVNVDNHKKCDGRGKQASMKMTRERDGEKEQCPDCGKLFVNLDNHKKCDGRGKPASMKTTRERDGEKEQCPDCGKLFVNLDNHKKCDGRGKPTSMKMTRERDGEKEQCPDCGKLFVNLDNHKKCDSRGKQAFMKTTKERDGEKEQCPDCGKLFVNVDNHKKCDGRGKPTSMKMTRERDGEKEQCPDCGKLFVNLDNHKKCDGRGKQASMKTTRERDGEKEQCPDCGKLFVNLDNHKKCDGRGKPAFMKTTKERDGEKEQCPDCGKLFVNLDNHRTCDGRGRLHSVKQGSGQTNARQTALQGDQSRPQKKGNIVSREEMERIVDEVFSKGILEKSKNPKSDILQFFGKQVTLRQQKMSDASAFFTPVVSSVIKRLEEGTSWKWKHIQSGSYFDGTKVSRPDEMDCMFVASIANLEVSTGGAPPGFCYVKPKHVQSDIDRFCEGGFVSSTLFRKHVFSCLNSLPEGNRRITRDTTLSEGSPSFGVNYDTGLTNEDGTEFIISMDLVPALHFPWWPDTARDFSREKMERLRNISNNGFHVVAKSYTGDKVIRNSHLLWRLSFSASEKILTKFADSRGADSDIRTCRKKVLRILKRMLEIVKSSGKELRLLETTMEKKSREVATALGRTAQFVRSRGYRVDKHRFTTFQLRTLMWNEFYMTTLGDHVWKTEDLVSRLGGVFIKLKKMLSGEMHVEHFFIRGLDIMAEVPLVERKYLYIMVCVMDRFL